VVGVSGCIECTNANGTTSFRDLAVSSKGYYSGGWYWSLGAPRCFYAPYNPQGYFGAYVTLRCDAVTSRWTLYVQAQALLSYLQDHPNCPYSPWAPYQQATCYFGWEDAVQVSVDADGKFQGQVDVPLGPLYGGNMDCCGTNCTLTFKFN
jgi:hypothetical protein